MKVRLVYLLTRSTFEAYCVANTKTPGADGNVPYKNPYVLRSVVSESLLPGFNILIISLVTKGSTILKRKQININIFCKRFPAYNLTIIKIPGTTKDAPVNL